MCFPGFSYGPKVLSSGLGLGLGIRSWLKTLFNGQERLTFESTVHIVCSIDQNTILNCLIAQVKTCGRRLDITNSLGRFSCCLRRFSLHRPPRHPFSVSKRCLQYQWSATETPLCSHERPERTGPVNMQQIRCLILFCSGGDSVWQFSTYLAGSSFDRFARFRVRDGEIFVLIAWLQYLTPNSKNSFQLLN